MRITLFLVGVYGVLSALSWLCEALRAPEPVTAAISVGAFALLSICSVFTFRTAKG
jgi:hypothetical protein